MLVVTIGVAMAGRFLRRPRPVRQPG
jgi:hypothetical protein